MQNQENFRIITTESTNCYATFLREQEKSAATVWKYVHDVNILCEYMVGKELTKTSIIGWKEELTRKYAPASVNSMLAAINGFLEWIGLPQYKVKPLKIQRAMFAAPEKELTQAEYLRLVQAAEHGNNHRLSLLLQTICSTGIRVSELKYITVSAIQTGRATVDCKGKTRTVFLPKALCRSLSRYCRQQGIKTDVIFCTKSGNPLNRSNIWRDMQALCEIAGVESDKVFPHNLRHLFARTYYTLEKDLARLADILGHSNVSTTRIYTMETGSIHAKQLDRLGLVLLKL